jgi:perosamine synthetase
LGYAIKWWRTSFQNGEAQAIAKAIDGEHISQGPIVREFESQLADYLGVPYAVTTTSGSNALLMSAWAAGVGPGDEVIVPNRTWIATAHAPYLLGAKIRLVDCRKSLPVIDTSQIERAITSKTKAIIPAHMCGRDAGMKEINAIAKKHNLCVIEDAAQALGSRNAAGFLGTQSDMGCFSFSVAKIIATGQGGFTVTRDKAIYDRLVKMRTQGVGDVMLAQWEQPGHNFRFNDILASIGIQQLKTLPARIEKLKEIYRIYAEGLQGLTRVKLIPVDIAAGEIPVYNEILTPNRDDFMNFLEAEGIETRPFYPGLDKAPYFGDQGAFPNADLFGAQGV